jgi:hypothetical protein
LETSFANQLMKSVVSGAGFGADTFLTASRSRLVTSQSLTVTLPSDKTTLKGDGNLSPLHSKSALLPMTTVVSVWPKTGTETNKHPKTKNQMKLFMTSSFQETK